MVGEAGIEPSYSVHIRHVPIPVLESRRLILKYRSALNEAAYHSYQQPILPLQYQTYMNHHDLYDDHYIKH